MNMKTFYSKHFQLAPPPPPFLKKYLKIFVFLCRERTPNEKLPVL